MLAGTMLAGERSSRGLRCWSRLADQCTWLGCSRPAGAALHLPPRPARVIWCLACWRSSDKGERKRGEGRDPPTSTRVLANDTPWTGQLVRPSAQAPPTALVLRICVTGIKDINGVRGTGRGNGAGGLGRGQGAMHVCKHTQYKSGNVPGLYLGLGVCVPSPSPCPQQDISTKHAHARSANATCSLCLRAHTCRYVSPGEARSTLHGRQPWLLLPSAWPCDSL